MALSDKQIANATTEAATGLLDHIYENGTSSLGVAPRIYKLARAIEAEVRKECDHMGMAADAEARRVDELTALHKQDTALIRQMREALGVATTPLAKDRQEVLRAIAAANERLGEAND